jgi:protein gp37
MKHTNIQWCHSSVNPVMGCDGCELWVGPKKVASNLVATAVGAGLPMPVVRKVVSSRLGGLGLSELVRRREKILSSIQSDLVCDDSLRANMGAVIKRAGACYAGRLHVLRAGHPGFADEFVQPKMFTGRTASAARWSAPSVEEQAEKPWLEGSRRLIFVSDMGDALSRGISFTFLRDEIITATLSPEGRRHIWLWVTKRPGRMAEFSDWLEERGTRWPENLVPMTTVTSMRTIGRVDELRKIPAPIRGLSCEPLWEPLSLDLAGIDWVIVGGGSDELAPAFQVEWALQLKDDCRRAGTAFFLKQLGRHPFVGGRALELNDTHGGDWHEWEKSWRVREIPDYFKSRQQSLRAR